MNKKYSVLSKHLRDYRKNNPDVSLEIDLAMAEKVKGRTEEEVMANINYKGSHQKKDRNLNVKRKSK